MKKSFLFFLLLVPNLSWTQPTVDSLQRVLKNNMLTSLSRIDVLNELAYQTRRSDQEFSIRHAAEALERSKKVDYKKGEATANITICVYYHTKATYDRSLAYGLSALQIFEALGDKKGLMDSYLMLGLTYGQLKNENKSEDYLNRSLALGLEIKNNIGIARAYNAIGNLTRNQKKNEKREVRNEAVRKIFMKALDYLKGLDDEPVKVIVLANLGDTYLRDRNPEKARPFLDESLRIGEKVKDKQAQVFIHLLLGRYHSDTGSLTMAEEHFLEGESLASQCGERYNLLAIYMELIELKTNAGKNSEAHSYLMKYSRARDSTFNIQKAQQIAGLEMRYETEKKEQAIKLLEQEKRIQTIWRNTLIVGVLLSLAATFLIYRLYISRMRKARQLLEVQKILNDKLKEVDKLKSGFFANISHEFRTPLTLILGPLEEELKIRPASNKAPLLLMKRNANRLLELVNQLLDLSKLEARKMELHVEQGNMDAFLRTITASFESLAQYKQIHFAQNVATPMQGVWYDKDKVEKIVTNLLSNAFKFTPVNGTVTFEAAIKKTPDKNSLIFSVSDTGNGIPLEEQELVFSTFYQTKQTSEGHDGGTGLGLSLVKELIKLYEGTIALQSTPGSGTIFSVELPIEREAFPANRIIENHSSDQTETFAVSGYDNYEGAKEHERLQDGKDSILIVEDNADLQSYICSILEKEFAIVAASNGEEALKIAIRIIPSLILTDLMMPKMDGIELTEKIKTDERTSHIPVILLTARNELQSRLEGLRTGADDYLTKPFSKAELLVRIRNLIEQRKLLAARFRERILVPITSSQQIPLDDKFLQKVRSVIERNIGDVSFTVEKLAKEIHLSRTQLLRKVKALIGLSPNDFIKDLRLKKAADMIGQRADTITQIGYSVGFSDQSYFTKCFKKVYGVTPTEYALQTAQKKEVTPK